MNHEYLFDIRVFCSLRVKANTEAEARAKLAELVDCASVNFGAIDGEPVVGEASMDGEAELAEVVDLAMSTDEIRDAARHRYATPSDDDIEIPDEAKVDRSNDGAWVEAQVWVPFAEGD